MTITLARMRTYAFMQVSDEDPQFTDEELEAAGTAATRAFILSGQMAQDKAEDLMPTNLPNMSDMSVGQMVEALMFEAVVEEALVYADMHYCNRLWNHIVGNPSEYPEVQYA